MKQVLVLLVAAMFAGNALAQSVPTQAPAPAPAAETQDADAQQAGQQPADSAQVPTVPVQSPKKSGTSIVLGVAGAAALVGLVAGGGGGDDKPAPAKPAPSKPSSP